MTDWTETARLAMRRGQFTAARAALSRAIDEDCTASSLTMRANMNRRLWKFDEARQDIDAALALDPFDGDAWWVSGALHLDTNKAKPAIAALTTARMHPPGGTHVDWTKAVAQLHAGQWAEGFKGYDARFAMNPPQPDPIPLWDGKSAGSLAVDAEQGYGDSIMFARYIPPGAVFRVPPPLLRYMRAQGYDAISNFETVDTDWRAPLMSLPRSCQPVQSRRPPGRSALTRKGRLNIGLVWQSKANGSGGFEEALHGEQKSCPFDLLLELADIPGVQLYSLQTGSGQQDIARTTGHNNIALATSLIETPRIFDFEDLASYMEQLDLIVSVDTAPLHLAGTLGKPTIALLNVVGSWQWGAGDKTPWYPSIEIVRQPKPFDWQGAVDIVRVKIEAM